MAWSFVSGSGANSINANLSYEVTTGDLLIVAIVAKNDPLVAIISLTYGGTGMTSVSAPINNTPLTMRMLYTLSPPTGTADLAPIFEPGPPPLEYVIMAAQFTGIDSFNSTNSDIGGTFTSMSASVTSDANDLVITAAAHDGGSQSFNAVSGQTSMTAGDTGNISFVFDYENGSTTSTTSSAEISSSELSGVLIGSSFTPSLSALFPQYHSTWGDTTRPQMGSFGG